MLRSWLTADLRILGNTRRRVQQGQTQQDQVTDDQTDNQEERRVVQRREFSVGGGRRDAASADQEAVKVRKIVWQRGLGSFQTRARKGTET